MVNLASSAPEFGLLLASIRRDEAGSGALKTCLGLPLDWERVLALGERHEILPALYRGLRDHQALVPADIQARLRTVYVENGQKNLFLTRTLLRLLGVFADQGISALAIKGPALSMLTYGDLTPRQLVDLDILIRPGDVDRARQVVMGEGWLPTVDFEGPIPKRILYAENVLSFRKGRDYLELHWDVAEKGVTVGINRELWWRDPQMVLLLEREVPTLGPENGLLYLCLHGTKHAWSRLKLVVDCADYLRAFPEIDWALVEERAHDAGLLRCLALGLRLAQSLGGISLPERGLAVVSRSAGTGVLEKAVTGYLDSSRGQTGEWDAWMFLLRARERLGDRLMAIVDQTFVPKQADWQAVRLPEVLSGLYYVIRPLRLLWKFSLNGRMKQAQ